MTYSKRKLLIKLKYFVFGKPKLCKKHWKELDGGALDICWDCYQESVDKEAEQKHVRWVAKKEEEAAIFVRVIKEQVGNQPWGHA